MAKKEWKQRLIPKKALFRASLIWETWVQTCYNYERMMGMACAHTFLPVVKSVSYTHLTLPTTPYV